MFVDFDPIKVDKYTSHYSNKIKVPIKTKKQTFQFFPTKKEITTEQYCNNGSNHQTI